MKVKDTIQLARFHSVFLTGIFRTVTNIQAVMT